MMESKRTVGGLEFEGDKTVLSGPQNWNPHLLVKVHDASAPWLKHCGPQCDIIRMAAEIDIAIF